MHIEHIAIWTQDLERLKNFYQTYFEAEPEPKYHNPAKQYESYFLHFTSGARLELMFRPDIPATRNDPLAQFSGYIHLAMAVGCATTTIITVLRAGWLDFTLLATRIHCFHPRD